MGLGWYAFRRKRQRWLRLTAGLVLLGMLAAGACLAGKRLGQLAAVYGESHCRNRVEALLLAAEEAAMAEGPVFPADENEGEDRLVLDGQALHRCRAAAGQELLRQLEQLESAPQQVALGTLLGSPLLLGRGPGIPLRVVPVGDGEVQVRSSLRDAGVNQVLYSLTLELSVTVTVILPGEARQISCTRQALLGEVLIRGEVPSVYGALGERGGDG